MPLSPSFSVSQTGLNPALVIITDDSSGSDILVTSRLITITDSEGNYVVPSGTTGTSIVWPLATNPISIDLLTEDKALSIRVDWLDIGGTSIYDLTQEFCLAQYNKNGFYYLVQNQALSPSIIQDSNYYSNLSQFWINIIGAIQMVEDADDIAASQNCLNRATYFLNNQSIYF